jgi:hypothetical protein
MSFGWRFHSEASFQHSTEKPLLEVSPRLAKYGKTPVETILSFIGQEI